MPDRKVGIFIGDQDDHDDPDKNLNEEPERGRPRQVLPDIREIIKEFGQELDLGDIRFHGEVVDQARQSPGKE